MEPGISKTENSNTLDIASKYGFCPECNKRYTYQDSLYKWCNQCNAKWFQQGFPNWTSGNKYIDNFIQETQLNAKWSGGFFEWIPYNRLTNIKYLAKGGFSTVYNAIWLDGYISWDFHKEQCGRYGSHSVV